MKIDEERDGKIKTFLAKKKPKSIKVFQFTKEMLPEIDKEYIFLFPLDFYIAICEFNPEITFHVFQVEIHCYSGNKTFEVGDYIGEQEGNYFVIKKEEFNRDWVRK